MTNAFDSMDLNKAYEIAGGYETADNVTFEKALAMVRADDAYFAEELRVAHEAELSLKAKQEKEEQITADAEEALKNAEFLKKEFEDKQLKEQFFADEEIKEAENNTVIYDINPKTKERFELEGNEKHAHFEMLFEKAKLDVWREKAGDKEFAQFNQKEKKKSLFAAIKSSFLGTVAHLRTSAQLENEAHEAARAIECDNKNFFAKQAGSMLSKLQKAFDFKSRINVSANSVIAACVESEKKTHQFAKKFADLAKRTTGKKKEYFAKVSVLTHQVKDAFKTQAKALWGQRYEIMANLRDKAPKIVTDLAATAVLVGATAASAPWLGGAVIGYGAYKAASAWVWPIVTHARKEARLAGKDDNTTKMKFWDRLKQSANTVVGTKAYMKEAAWGSAAGLIGLGAVGATAAVGSSALLQKSVQSLSSTAVYTANSLIHTIKKIREKDSNLLSKGLAVASTAVMAYVLTSCGEHANDTLRMPQPNSELSPENISSSADSVISVNENTGTVAPRSVEPINIPENWESDMGITEAQWTRLQSFWGSKEKYDYFYNRITDDMLKDDGIFAGKTREQVLFQYERLSSWDLTQHKEYISRLDAFFECGETLSNEDAQVLNDVLPNGAIRDINGTLNVQITGRDIECGEEAILHSVSTERPDVHPVSAPENTPEQPEAQFTLVDGGSANIDITDGSHPQQTGFVKYQYKNDGNGNVTYLSDGQVVSDEEIANISLDNKNPNVALRSSDGFKITSEGFRNSADNGGFEEITTEELNQNNSVVADVYASSPSEQIFTLEKSGEGVINVNNDTHSVVSEGFRNGADNGGFEEITTEELNQSNSVVADVYASSPSEPIFTVEKGSEVIINVNDDTHSVVSDDFSINTSVDGGNIGIDQIVANSDDVATGTPAADNVPERGGYMNTGLTEKQYHRMETFFKDQFGENAFEAYMEKISDDMRAKGGIFEGLSKAQSLYSVQQMIAWSNDQHGAFAEEITSMVEYLKDGCKENLTISESSAIKSIIDRVNENGTINGVIGDKPAVVRYFQANACSEPGTYHVDEVANSGTTHPFGEGFKRFFKKIITPAEKPFTIGEEGSATIVLETAEPKIIGFAVYDYKNEDGNGFNILGKNGDISQEELAERLKDVKIKNPDVAITAQGFRRGDDPFEEVTAADLSSLGYSSQTPEADTVDLTDEKLTDSARQAVRAAGRDPDKITNQNLIYWINKTHEGK